MRGYALQCLFQLLHNWVPLAPVLEVCYSSSCHSDQKLFLLTLQFETILWCYRVWLWDSAWAPNYWRHLHAEDGCKVIFSALALSLWALFCLHHLLVLQLVWPASSFLCIWTRFIISLKAFESCLNFIALPYSIFAFNMTEFAIFYFPCLEVMSAECHPTLVGSLGELFNPFVFLRGQAIRTKILVDAEEVLWHLFVLIALKMQHWLCDIKTIFWIQILSEEEKK